MNPVLAVVAGQQGGVFSRRQALEAGYTPEQVQERLKAGRWHRVRHGQYAERVDLSELTPWERELWLHRQLVHAAMNSMKPGTSVVSHHSALILHGIPVWEVDLSEVQLTRTSGWRSGRSAGVMHHRGPLGAPDIGSRHGLAVTVIGRALVESAAAASFEAAVVSADAVLRSGELTDDELRRVLVPTEFWAGGPTIRAALAFADPLAESVGESRLRVLMHDQRLPAPVLQAGFKDAAGFVGRVDFYFPDHSTVVEFDGLLKYATGSSDVLIREKTREDRLRALGLEVVRLTWLDLAQPARTAAAIRRAFDRSRRTHVPA
ncbi:type IV toxin-antitoxin system AbiEi family antitoxin domain-containing protein [Kribbella sandramycini]|uniref:Type IV toxin-antitoxin system AbiEi family antitoxin domain-containing protein n=2 Tax=Kribbella sandramycini TaxID=60450 RepID=A0A7Y4L805_9ACTN|nr:type IV toxin-antitoxin system AbiEi family antitoxin domain-containing protein [Kribbella sandramycini]NOL45011.1 type IV toxin-antitoxin system AbiEi family antitoxin domain-containing protein [Kribbella sandramycini]